jgi:tripartite-type tricarboxylate transporter receptor subunit TctC
MPAFAGTGKVDFPQKGKTITIIVPAGPGGTSDITARLIAPVVEKELGVPVVVSNKTGAGGQVGLTEAALATPDGYTLIATALQVPMHVYLNPDRKGVPQIRELQPVALHNTDLTAVVVSAQSPYHTVKDVVDAAKATPGGLRAATDGLMFIDHIATLEFMRRTGTKFRIVHFDGGSPATTALAGGHVDVRVGKVGSVYAMMSAGKLRIVGVMGEQRSKFCPDVKTLIEQGYKDYTWFQVNGILAPPKTPREIVDILSNAIKKAASSEEALKRLDGVALAPYYKGPDEFAAYWKDFEKFVGPLISKAREE